MYGFIYDIHGRSYILYIHYTLTQHWHRYVVCQYILYIGIKQGYITGLDVVKDMSDFEKILVKSDDFLICDLVN